MFKVFEIYRLHPVTTDMDLFIQHMEALLGAPDPEFFTFMGMFNDFGGESAHSFLGVDAE